MHPYNHFQFSTHLRPPPLRASNARVKEVLGVVSVFTIVLVIYQLSSLLAGDRPPREINYGANNATLGFEKIIAVAATDYPDEQRWRLEGLKKAAVRSGLDIDILRQPDTYQDEAHEILLNYGSIIQGDALSWTGHRNAIRAAAKLSTALIIEDDTDWDVDIRRQMPQIAAGLKELSGVGNGLNTSMNDLLDPYGAGWDVLWLGHCGDFVRFDKPLLRFYDPLVPPYMNSWEKSIAPDPKHTRWLHVSTGPLCTFGYALRKKVAQYILKQDAVGKGPFDVWLHLQCKNLQLRCFTVNPELFHHHELAGARASMIRGQSEEIVEKNQTQNIWHSARCNSDVSDYELVTCMGLDERQPGKDNPTTRGNEVHLSPP